MSTLADQYMTALNINPDERDYAKILVDALVRNNPGTAQKFISELNGSSIDLIDLIWLSPYHMHAKHVAFAGTQHVKGIYERTVTDGIGCRKCKSKNTVSSMVQIRAGDEGVSVRIQCMDCSLVDIMND